MSSLLPLSVYRFTKVYFRSHDAACLAAILVAMSTHLTVLGTHPLLNTFLSPFVFWALSCVHPVICGQRHPSSRSEDLAHAHAVRRGRKGQNENAVTCRTLQEASSEQVECTRETTPSSSCRAGEVSSTIISPCLGQVLNGTAPHANGTAVHESPRTPTTVRDSGGQNRTSKPACLSATPAGPSWFRAGRNSVSRNKQKTEHRRCSHKTRELLVDFFSALVLALCVYMRVDVALFAAVTLLPRFCPRLAEYRALLVSALGAFVGVCLGVLEDFFFYDELVVSPGNWAKFNVFRGMAGELFGKSSATKYLVALFGNNFGLPALAGLSAIVIVSVLVRGVTDRPLINRYVSSSSSRDSSNNSSDTSNSNNNNNSRYVDNHRHHNGKSKDPNDEKNNTVTENGTDNGSEPTVSIPDGHGAASLNTATGVGDALTLTSSWLLLLGFYSFREHKELRFVHNAIVLMLISFASVFSVAVKELLCPRLSPGRVRAIVLALLSLLAADQWSSFPSSRDRSNRAWAYQGIWDSHDVNACLSYVGAQKDATGVFVDSNFHVTGGYTLLHRDVPLFTLLVHEFVEFEAGAGIDLHKPSLLDGARNVSYLTIDRLSNLVSVQNAGYMVKLLIQKKQYNYLVMARQRKFLAVGYKEAFAQGTMRVMKRTFDPEEERQLQAMAAKAPMGVNATVLKYEGDVLFRFHRFQLALERYQAAFQLDPAQATLFQAIGACKLKLGDQSGARRWIEACAQRFGPSECEKALSITNINPDRHLF